MNTNSQAVFIADDFHPDLMHRLEQNSIPFVYAPMANRAEIITQLHQGYQGLVIRSKTPVDEEILMASTQLKWVARGGSGMDNIDVDSAKRLGVEVFNAAAANADSVAEHTLGMLLALMHNLARADAEVRKRLWRREENRGTELKGKTVGIIGYGNTGTAVAERLQGFGVTVLVYDKYKKNFGNKQVKEVDLESIQRNSDVITLHVPLTEETRYMVDAAFIGECKRPFYLLNLSRGEVVKTIDVISAMENNHIAGFAADVLENEQIHQFSARENAWFDPLIQQARTVLSPHIGGWSYQSYQKISQVLADEICQRMSL